MLSPPAAPARSPSPSILDPNTLYDFKYHHGQAFRHQAFELIKLCQLSSLLSGQNIQPYTALLDVLRKCDVALSRAVELRKRTTEAEFYFEIAVVELKRYHRNFLHRRPTDATADMERGAEKSIDGRMEDAKKSDIKAKNSMNPAKHSNQGSVEFRILRTLLDPSPIIVRQTLNNSTGSSVLPEILWNFVHFKGERRLQLAQNPHFYRDLPSLRNGYQGNFQTHPTQTYKGTIYVLTNNSHRVILEGVSQSRVLDNVWDTSNTLIVRDILGKLQGETIVGESVPPPKLFWYRIEPPLKEPEKHEQIDDWKTKVRTLCDPPVINDSHEVYALTPTAPNVE